MSEPGAPLSQQNSVTAEGRSWLREGRSWLRPLYLGALIAISLGLLAEIIFMIFRMVQHEVNAVNGTAALGAFFGIIGITLAHFAKGRPTIFYRVIDLPDDFPGVDAAPIKSSSPMSREATWRITSRMLHRQSTAKPLTLLGGKDGTMYK